MISEYIEVRVGDGHVKVTSFDVLPDNICAAGVIAHRIRGCTCYAPPRGTTLEQARNAMASAAAAVEALQSLPEATGDRLILAGGAVVVSLLSSK